MNNFEMTQEFLLSNYDYDPEGFLVCKRRQVRVGSYDKTCGYYKILIVKKTYRVHRLIFLFHHGYLPTMVDHINGDRGDNKIENLQEADSSINSLKKVNTIKYSPVEPDKIMNRFVSYKRDHKKYAIDFRVNGKKEFIGYYSSLDEANYIAASLLEDRINDMDYIGFNVRIPEVV